MSICVDLATKISPYVEMKKRDVESKTLKLNTYKVLKTLQETKTPFYQLP